MVFLKYHKTAIKYVKMKPKQVQFFLRQPIFPVFKSGHRADLKNRPISIIPNLANIFERLISDQLKEFVAKEDFLYKSQLEF